MLSFYERADPFKGNSIAEMTINRMIEIGRTIISLDVFEKHFLCDLLKCKGACCVEGDSGAPVTEDEANKLKRIIRSSKNTFLKNIKKK